MSNYASELLKTASELVGGDRPQTHGDHREAFEDTAKLISDYLETKYRVSHGVTPEDVAVIQMLVKLSRTFHGQFNIDDYVDMAGYAAIAGALAADAGVQNLDASFDDNKAVNEGFHHVKIENDPSEDTAKTEAKPRKRGLFG